MMTREELYGGSVEIEYTMDDETFIMPDGTDLRVWLVLDDELSVSNAAIRLPDPLSIRNASGLAPAGSGSAGGPIFYIVNFGLVSVNLEDSEGNVLGFLGIFETFVVSLFNAFVPGGQWCLIKKPITSAGVGLTDQTISFGSEIPLFDQVRAYSYEEDVWQTKTPTPFFSGDSFAATAVDAIDPRFGETFTGLMQHFNFFEFIDSVGGGSYIKLDDLGFEAANTGIADSTGGVTASSTLNDFFYTVNGAVNPTQRATETYTILTDLWAAGPPTPSALSAWGPTVTCDEGFQSLGNIAIFISPGQPESAAGWYALFLVTQAYLILPSPPWPWGATFPSVVGLESRMHYQNGNFNFSASPNPGFSTDSHYEFSKFLGTWSSLPRSPVVARGMGIRGTSIYLDRYTFGMGADAGIPIGNPFIRHIEYNTASRAYRERATAAWADSDHRDGSWARMEAFDA